MSQAQNFEYPFFPLPPPYTFLSPPKMPPPFHPIAPPTPWDTPPSPLPKPPPHHVSPPTPTAKPPKPPGTPPSPIPKPPPHPFSPPIPPPKPTSGPPPHPISPPRPPPPPPPPSHHATVIVVFVALGGLFFLAFLSAALFCFIKKRRTKISQETDDLEIDERVKVQEAIVPGSHGEQAMLVTIEEDIHTHETVTKNEIVGEASHMRSGHNPHSLGGVTASHHIENKS